MEFRSYTHTRYGKNVKSTGGLIKYINTCKIQIPPPSGQSLKLVAISEDNMTNPLNLSLDNNKKDICQRVSNNSNKRIRLVPVDTMSNYNTKYTLTEINYSRLNIPKRIIK